jgi:hypothetical protein
MGASAQGVERDIPNVVGLRVWQVILQKMQTTVDLLNQPRPLAHLMDDPDASVSHRPGSVGHVVTHVRRPEHRLILVRPLPNLQASLDPPLASLGPALSNMAHLKCLLAVSEFSCDDCSFYCKEGIFSIVVFEKRKILA